MECSICLNHWDSVTHIPRLIPCGHTFCQPCILLLIQKHKPASFLCSLCQKPSSIFEESQVQELIKNFTLLSATISSPTASPIPETKKQVTVASVGSREEKKEECKNQSLNPPKVLVLQKCARHNHILQFWDTQTRQLLCGRCFQQRSLNERDCCVALPQVAPQIRRRISATRELLRLRKSELNKVELYLRQEKRKVPERAKKQLQSTLTALQEMVTSVGNGLKKKLASQISQNENTFKSLLSELDKVKEELVNQDQILEGIDINSDQDLFEMWESLQEITVKARLFEVNDLFDFGEVDIAIRTSQGLFTQIGGYLSKAIVIEESEPCKFGKEVTPSSLIHLKSGDWLCLHCEQNLDHKEIFCRKCQKFRDISTLPNLLYNPNSSTPQEIEYITRRRQVEKQIIVDQDQYQKGGQEMWYVVSQEWMTQWKMFILNKEFKKKGVYPRMSANPAIGMFPPPPMSNLCLLLKSPHGYSVRPGLVNAEDYRIINQHVWHQLVRIYEGGPPIYTKTGLIADAKVKQNVQKERRSSKSRYNSPHLMNFKSQPTQDIKDTAISVLKKVGVKRAEARVPLLKQEMRDASRSMRNIFDKAKQPSVRGRSVRVPEHKDSSKIEVYSFRGSDSNSEENNSESDRTRSQRESLIKGGRRNIFSKY